MDERLFPARPVEHGRCHVDTDGLAGWPDFLGGQEGIDAGTRTQVEHGFARLHRGVLQWVATTQTQVGALRNGAGLITAVSKSREFGRATAATTLTRLGDVAILVAYGIAQLVGRHAGGILLLGGNHFGDRVRCAT